MACNPTESYEWSRLLATALRTRKLLTQGAGPVAPPTRPVLRTHQPVLEPKRLGRIPRG